MLSTPVTKPLIGTPRDLAEFSWDLAQVAELLVTTTQPIADEHLVCYWVTTRGLANQWLRGLQEWTEAGRTADDFQLLETVAAEMLIGDMLLRLWGTILSIQDRQSQQNNARAVLDLVVFNLQHVRHRLLAVLLVDARELAELDRLRRRCERWTDLLIAPLAVRFGHTQYAHDARRAWDFGEDAAETGASDIAARMLQSSFRTAFDAPCTRQPLLGESWATILHVIDDRAAGCLGTTWPRRWQNTADVPQPDAADGVSLTPDDADESAFVRSLRRLQPRRPR